MHTESSCGVLQNRVVVCYSIELWCVTASSCGVLKQWCVTANCWPTFALSSWSKISFTNQCVVVCVVCCNVLQQIVGHLLLFPL